MEFLSALWRYILTAAPYLMFGLLVSGFIQVFISAEKIKKAMGGKGFSGVLRASLLGIPLPLCSCAVIPTAATLKKNGASNSATSAFLISTPESGIDSIAMTYGMMDLPMTIIRPVAAFCSAFVAGLLQMLFNKDENTEAIKALTPEKEAKSCCAKPKSSPDNLSFRQKLIESVRFAFIELIDDMAFWLALGIFAGALIDFMIPNGFFEGLGGWAGRLTILAVGIPLYICASATTPIAASLVMKGMSPGMALLFLLVGPATNVSNILVIGQYIGKKGVVLNVIAIAGVALIMSFLVDYLYEFFAWPINYKVLVHQHQGAMLVETVMAVIFSILLGKSLIKKELPKLLKKIKNYMDKPSSCCGN